MLIKQDNSFLLDIRSDNGSGNEEKAVHRKIIELFKSRDDFKYIDLRIQTSQGLSGTTRVDVSNALAHMRNKCKKTLRKLTADMDYMDPSVHEFVLLQCLSFRHVCLTSNPEFEETNLSVGLAMSLQHALCLNAHGHGTHTLELTCAISQPVSELLAEAMRQARELNTLRLHLLGDQQHSSRWIGGILAGLTGKGHLEVLHLRDVNACISEELANLLGDNKCRVKELSLSYDWAMKPKYSTQQLCQALMDMVEDDKKKKSGGSIKTLLLDGIQFDPPNTEIEEGTQSTDPSSSFLSSSTISSSSSLKAQYAKPSSSTASTRVLPLAFPNMETLSLAAPQMPRLAFLELPQDQLPKQLKHCYFPCSVLDMEQGRNLVEAVSSIVDVPEFASDPYVRHLLDWRKILEGDDPPTAAALWPGVLERANTLLKDHPHRQANMLYTLLQDYYGLLRNGQLVYPKPVSISQGGKDKEEEEEEDGNDVAAFTGGFGSMFDDAGDGDY